MEGQFACALLVRKRSCTEFKSMKTQSNISCLASLTSPQHHQQLSASLKERLKRSRRSFTAPFSVAKRLCVDEKEAKKEGNGQQVSADSQETLIVLDVDVNRNEEKSGSERFPGPVPKPTHPPPSKDFTRQRDQLKKEVKDKMETLRRLKMVKMYRNKVQPTLFNLSGLPLT